MLSRGVIPVFGARTPAQLADCLEASRVALEPDDLRELAEASEPAPAVPHNAIRGGRSIIYGGYADRIDAPALRAIPGDDR